MRSGDPQDVVTARARRRHPAERAMSFRSGLLLLVLMAQAAFGYALVAPDRAAWFRTVHLAGAFLVVALAAWLDLSARRLPFPGLRRSALRAMCRVLAVLVVLQASAGLVFRGIIPSPGPALRDIHIGIGLLSTFWILAIHMTCIWPSVSLGAQREWEASWGGQEQDPDRKL